MDKRRVMVISDYFPDDLSSGRQLRVSNLCQVLTQAFDCYFVALSESRGSAKGLDLPLFIDMRWFKPPGEAGKHVLRHLRLSNARYVETTWPNYFDSVSGSLKELCAQWAIDGVVNFAPLLGEFSLTLDLPCLLDITDCDTLTIERVLRNRGTNMTSAERWKNRLQRHRQVGRESHLVREHSAVTTIAEPDRLRLLELSGASSGHVTVVPNGVTADAINRDLGDRPPLRSVVFWGNLDFPPNWTAVEYFYERVFLPFLQHEGVEWIIIGKGAGPRVAELAKHPLITLKGYVDDLFGEIAGMGVMINPMVEGSGLKNKVIESFAVGIPVVSTPLGVEAIDGEDGTHFLVASDDRGFADSILCLLNDPVLRAGITDEARRLVDRKYTWMSVGAGFSEIVASMVTSA